MTRLYIDPGICGFCASLYVQKKGKRRVELFIESDCEMVKGFGEAVKALNIKDIFSQPFNNGTVYGKAAECGLHASCPIPCGVLKAAEAELGLAVMRSVKMVFEGA